MSYNPEPIDTKDIELASELLELTDLIAEQVHDTWAKARLEEGWTYGEERSAEAKTTPWLVPYAELPESEKEYDRRTALETIKIIVKLGYKIEGPKRG